MKIKVLRKDVKEPTTAYESAGIDCYAPKRVIINHGEVVQVKLGLAIQIKPNEVCIVSERSGHAIKHGLTTLGNVIDADYRGEISCIMFNGGRGSEHSPFQRYVIEKGEKICQLLVLKLGDKKIEIVDELTNTERGKKAHTSSGK